MGKRMRWMASVAWLLLAATAARAQVPDLVPPVTGQSAPTDAAVVIGIESYYNLPPTPYAVSDAALFHRFLVDTVGVPPERVANLHAVKATRERMVEALEQRAAQVGRGGTLWVYYSGHGAPAPGGDTWLLGIDAESSLRSMEARSLRRSEIQATAERAGVDRVVVVLDACFSGRGRDGAALGKERFIVPGNLVPVPNAVVWTAASGGQVAGPFEPARHGLFTYFAVGALSGWGDTDKDTRVTLDEASEYVRRMMEVALSTGERRQTPELAVPDGGGRWVLASGVRPTEGPDARSLSLGGSATRPSGGIVQPGVKLDRGEKIVNRITDETGFLTVSTVPDGATLTINGKEMGRSPQQLELMAGRYVVVAELGGLYHEASEEVALGTSGVRLTLELAPAFGRLEVSSEPSGADVWLDGEKVGTTPYSKDKLRSGTYELRVERALHLTHKATVAVRDGETTREAVRLTANYGALVVESEPSGADVWLDGEKVGTTPYSRDKLRSGSYELRVERALHLSHKATVAVRDGQPTREAVRLTANYGALVVESEPAGAAIWLNGEATGLTTPHTFEPLQVGAYVVKLSRDGYGAASDRGLVERQGTARLRLALQAKLGLLSVLAKTRDGRPCEGQVLIDGTERGTTPLKVQVTATLHEVEVRCPEGTAKQSVTVEHNGKQALSFEVGAASFEVETPRGYVRIEAGRFAMGSPGGESGRDDDEVQHEVVITRAYWLKATEVTQGEWQEVMPKLGGVMDSNPSLFGSCGDGCPVEGMSWWDGLAYCNALSRKEGLTPCYDLSGCSGTPGTGGSPLPGGYKCPDDVRFEGLGCTGYRLPTEAEWEHAARAGSTAARYGELDAVAWYGGNSGSSTHPVGGRSANAWGLYDMLGNVAEWTWDRYGSYPSGRVSDPEGASSGAVPVFRGGFCFSDADFVRAAHRDRLEPAWRRAVVGLRPARSIP